MTNALLGFFTPWIIYTLITALHYFLPGRWVQGYVNDMATGEKLNYRLNGLSVLLCMIGLWYLLGYLDWVPSDWLYTVRWYSLAGACTIGLIFSLLLVLPYPATGKPWLVDFFLGRLENPQWQNGRIDAKMWLYMVGAVMLALNVLSFWAHHVLMFDGVYSPGMRLCFIMLLFFVADYFTFEHVHLYTYDFFAERVGFKLGWGCLAFYPYFYAIALWSTVDLPDPGTPNWQLVLFGLIFLSGWVLSRGANLQKFYFKTGPEDHFLWIKPATISSARGTLLINGFWGLSKHINYLGEILMAVGIALSVGYPGMIWPWLYPLYYVALLVPRQMDDDKRCAAKYGDLWQTYSEKVKYRIIPFLY